MDNDDIWLVMILKQLLVLVICVHIILMVEGNEIINASMISYANRSPGAPDELKTFEFLIGKHTCEDQLISQDGTITRVTGHWSGHYILNGNAIQDDYWNSQYSTTNIRIFDPDRKLWQVTYFRFPGYRTGVWEGDKEGANIALRREFLHIGETVVSELIFENITEHGFFWSAKYISNSTKLVNWTSDCKRVSP